MNLVEGVREGVREGKDESSGERERKTTKTFH